MLFASCLQLEASDLSNFAVSSFCYYFIFVFKTTRSTSDPTLMMVRHSLSRCCSGMVWKHFLLLCFHWWAILLYKKASFMVVRMGMRVGQDTSQSVQSFFFLTLLGLFSVTFQPVSHSNGFITAWNVGCRYLYMSTICQPIQRHLRNCSYSLCLLRLVLSEWRRKGCCKNWIWRCQQCRQLFYNAKIMTIYSCGGLTIHCHHSEMTERFE